MVHIIVTIDISCSIPNEAGQLKKLVLLLQQHKHSLYCRRNKVCWFKFPQPPSSTTLISKPNADDSVTNDDDSVTK